jgi:hypothetical protein
VTVEPASPISFVNQLALMPAQDNFLYGRTMRLGMRLDLFHPLRSPVGCGERRSKVLGNP